MYIVWFIKLQNIKNPKWCNCTTLYLPAGNAHTYPITTLLSSGFFLFLNVEDFFRDLLPMSVKKCVGHSSFPFEKLILLLPPIKIK